MAGSKLYIGEMMDDFKLKLDSVMTKIDAQIAALDTINTSVSGTVSELKTKQGFGIQKTASTAEFTKAITATVSPIFLIVAHLRGAAVLQITMKSTSAAYPVTFCYSIDGGQTYIDITTTPVSTAFNPYTFNVPVKPEGIVIGAKVGTGVTLTFGANGFIFNYDTVNIMTGVPFAIC